MCTPMSKWPYNTATWQRLRAAKLSEQPLCEACLRREVVEPAVAVDHVVAINAGGDPFPPLDGLMSLCEACHNSKTNAKDHPSASGFRRALKGVDTDGNPIDPEGWEAPLSARYAAGNGMPEPGADSSRETARQGPAGETKTDLVSANDSQQGSDQWV